MSRVVSMSAVALLIAACTGGGDDTGPVDTGDTGAEAPAAMIDEALDCGTPASAGGLAEGTELTRYDLDLDAFPDAMCNDGTPGFFYYRPSVAGDSEDRWVIQLQGGGGCRDATSCLNRWCSVDTNFGMTQMTGTVSPQGIDGKGILARHAENPFGDAHHVLVRYCSSDAWQGQRSDVVLAGSHPVSGDEVEARVHFQGAAIVDAVIETLREEHGLDEATSVLFAGASAGGSGMVANGDHVHDTLTATNPGLEFRILHDSNFRPSAEVLDLDDTSLCTELELCDYETFYLYEEAEGTQVLRDGRLDQSCLDHHAGAGDTWACVDAGHVLRHHVTSPLMVRASQTDSLLTSNLIDGGFGYDGQPLDQATYARLVREEAAALADATAAEEADAYTVDPAVFIPTCPKHETLSSNADTFTVTIDVGGTAYDMFEVFGAWRQGSTPRAVIASAPSDNTCP